ncbi:MAG: signal peptidase II [Phycisphaeraceae bacterium]
MQPAADQPAPEAAPAREPSASRCPAAIAVFLGIMLAVLAADLGLKHWTFNTPAVAGEPVFFHPDHAGPVIAPHQPRPVVPGVLQLELVANPGAVFGIGAGHRWVFIGVSLVAIAVVGVIFLRSSARAWPTHLALALILGGALGNLYDRIRYSVVRDMLHLFPGWELPFGWTWTGGDARLYPWIFNIADVALVAGVLLMIAITLVRELRPQAEQSAPG